MMRSRVPTQKFKFFWCVQADITLSASAKCVMTALLFKFHNNKTGQCNPSASAIAATVGHNRRNIFPAIDELKAGGWLTTITTKGGSSRNTNQFKFNFEYTGPVSSTSPPPVTPTPPVTPADQGVTSTPHEPLKNHSPLQGEGVCAESKNAGAPCGAPHEEKFEQLCQVWRKPDGVNRNAAWKAFALVCEDHDADVVIASAARWVAATPDRYLKKLEVWLGNGAWLNEPPTRQPGGGYGGKPNPVDEMLNAGGLERHHR